MHSCQGSAIFSRERTAKRNCQSRGLGSSGGNGLAPTGSPAPESLRAGPGRLETPPSRLDTAGVASLDVLDTARLGLVEVGVFWHSPAFPFFFKNPFFIFANLHFRLYSFIELPSQTGIFNSVPLGSVGWLLKSLISRLYFRSFRLQACATTSGSSYVLTCLNTSVPTISGNFSSLYNEEE